MTKGRKNRIKILQGIKQKLWEKNKHRKKKLAKRKVQYHEPRIGLPIQRKFRSQRTNSNISRISNKELSTNKRNLYIKKYLPTNLNYLLKTSESPFSIEDIKKQNFKSNGIVELPKNFSIIEEPEESYIAIQKTISALLLENNNMFLLDYKKCEKIELGTQVLLDIILKDFLQFTAKCQKIDRNHRNYFPIRIGGINIDNEEVKKMMFSVGSPVTLKVKEHKFPDIIPYKLCIHDNEKEQNYEKRIEQKELDTTEMADYVIDCLARMNKKLTSTKRDDLCTVIGEILINAEEHSTTKYRFSIGYFKEVNIENKHYGIFRLVILNFGKTIYEKFKSDDCENQEIVTKMKNLSHSYTKRNLFLQREFEEENLWTLYALQEEVSSISPTEYKRGNGSIRFIDSFFNIKGSQDVDDISYLTIQSGKTRIHFNGEYSIVSKTNSNNESYKIMTFNNSGNIEDKPDSNFVYQTKDYFPGTIISAKLLLNDDDVEQLKN
jgi:hypothetical protein